MEGDIENQFLQTREIKSFLSLNCVLVISVSVAQLVFLPCSLIIQKNELVICKIENVKKEKNKKSSLLIWVKNVLLFGMDFSAMLLISQKNYNNQNSEEERKKILQTWKITKRKLKSFLICMKSVLLFSMDVVLPVSHTHLTPRWNIKIN